MGVSDISPDDRTWDIVAKPKLIKRDMKTKRYEVQIELQTATVYVSAKGIREAKKKAIEKLKKKNVVSLIDWEYNTHRKKIWVDAI